MILYIHGFGSSGFGSKALLFKKEFEDILTPSLSYVPILAMDTLEQLIITFRKKGEKINLVGSSLGGFYCIYLACKYNLKAVLINPAIYPYETLKKVGVSKNYFDFSSFESTLEHLNSLKTYEIKKVSNEENFMILLQKGDEVLDYTQAFEKFPNAKLFVEEGGNHSFENIERFFPKIKEFFYFSSAV